LFCVVITPDVISREIACQENKSFNFLIFTKEILFNLPSKGFDVPFGNRWSKTEPLERLVIFLYPNSRSFFLTLHWSRKNSLLFAVSVSRSQKNNPFY
jgi:hypothetical protein